MDGKVTPKRLPFPRTALGYDGTDFVALKTDADGRLIVRGEDQLLSYKEALHDRSSGAISGAGGYKDSGSPTEGETWHVTNVAVSDATSPTTALTALVRAAAADYNFDKYVAAIGAAEWNHFKCDLYLDYQDVVRVYFTGGLVGDTCYIDLLGCKMTAEA